MASHRAASGARRTWQIYHELVNNKKWKSKTLNNYFLIGKILPGRTPYEEATGFDPENFGLMPALQRIEVRVPYYVFDEGLKSYFEHEWDYQCNDPLKLEPIAGDTVIIKKSHFGAKGHDTIHLRERAEGEWWNPKPRGTGLNGFRRRLVTHEIAKILHPIGDIIDPISKEPVVGDRYRSETERYQKIYGKSKSEFDYKTAPKRGSQKDKRDFSYRRTYKRWHEFKDVDPYAIVC